MPSLEWGVLQVGYERRNRDKIVEQFPGDAVQTVDTSQTMWQATTWLAVAERLEPPKVLGDWSAGFRVRGTLGVAARARLLKDEGTSSRSRRGDIGLRASLSIGSDSSPLFRLPFWLSIVVLPGSLHLGDLTVDDYHFDFAGNPVDAPRVQKEPWLPVSVALEVEAW